MAATNKRKWRWSSKGLFSVKASNKQTFQDRSSVVDVDSVITPSAFADKSSGSGSNNDGRTRSRLPSKKHRTNFRLLSAIGLQRNSGVRNTNSSYTSERDIAIAIIRDATKTSSSRPSCTSQCDDHGHPLVTQEGASAPRNGENPQLTIATIAKSDVRGNICHSKLESVAIKVKSQDSKRVRQCNSNPSLAHQLSHKLSQTFGNPTVIHRPKMCTRPSLISLQDTPMLDPELQIDQETSRQDSTAPSSNNYSGSVSATDPSTGKTSLESGPGTPRSVKAQEGKEALVETNKTGLVEIVHRENTLTPIQEVPTTVTPTFVTVETTANAKIFFETYFNSLLAGHASSRSRRRRDLELYLRHCSLPEEQREILIRAWANRESVHLRQSRVLKSRSDKSTRGSGVAVAGYEVVRVLGKGSFGVVRLVREKDIATRETFKGCSASVQAQNSKQRDVQGENASFNIITIDPLKSTFEGHKTTQRENMAKLRRDVYAMKVIRKSDMLRNCQEGHLRAERDFLVASERSQWVVPLIASFQDDTNLYLVMEYMVGGDFLGLLFRKDKLKEKQARWYIGEMILCVEETHRARWIHRDIKPDNFLISSSGHLKISDFGLAFDGHWAHDQKYYKNTRASLMEKLGIKVKGDFEDQEEDEKKKPRSSLANILTGWRGDSPPKQVQFDGPEEKESILQWKNRTGRRRMAASVVGTSQYMAPEVIRGDPYDGRCDWWSIGIILYECLYGFTPFVCDKREDTKAKILDNAHSLNFPNERDIERSEKVSFEAMDLINSLLQEKEHRLSSNKYKMNDWQHIRYSSGHIAGRRADPGAQDYPGIFVYPNDACDIKAHPFFGRIIWERLHLTRPPWVPQVSGDDDTQWFDDEEGAPVSDVDDAASRTDVGEKADDRVYADWHVAEQATQVDAADTPRDKRPTRPILMGEAGATRQNVDKAKVKKRPRDRVLRDKEVGRKALELRKKGAFLGYTYRRPKLLSFENEREKQRSARRSLIPSFQ